MRSLETGFHDKAGYLERMSHSLREKLRIADFINSSDPRILDVGCADGTVTRAIGQLFPGGHVTGIDLSDDFLAKAREDHSAGAPMFEKIFLWEVREQGRRFTTILFTSVLHEIYHYGEKLQSVQNALTNSYAMLEPGGRIIIRDMILPESMRAPSELGNRIIAKIRSRADLQPLVADFERAHGPLSNLYGANHFLLKYFYTDNWERECPENYVPVTIEEYQAITRELGGTMLVNQSYLIPYLREKWRTDFDLSDGELEALVSTRIVVIEKEVRR